MTRARDLAAFVSNADGDIKFDTDTLFIDSSANRVGIGETAPERVLHIKSADNIIGLIESTDADAWLAFQDDTSASNNAVRVGATGDNLRFYAGSAERMRIDDSGNVGIGTNSPAAKFELEDGGTSKTVLMKVTADDSSPYSLVIGNDTYSTSDTDGLAMYVGNSGEGTINMRGTSSSLQFRTVGSERMRVDSSGNVLVGTTSTDISNEGAVIFPSGVITITNDGGRPLRLNRKTSDGDILQFDKDGSTVGSIGAASGGIYIQSQQNDAQGVLVGIRDQGGTTNLVLGATATSYGYIGDTSGSDVGVGFVSTRIQPTNAASGAGADNVYDIGISSARWDDIFATNGTIQTSDEREKQNIASLTSAEITAATAISKLFKTYKWNDKVEAKGDAARTHTGVVAQQVETAMSDAGLDASKYAFWCSDTWWQVDGGEAYDTQEEAPEGATERNRKGIRYPELLAFIGAATEQRLTSIEARLDALEA